MASQNERESNFSYRNHKQCGVATLQSIGENEYFNIVLPIFANEPSFHWIQLFKNNEVVFQLDPVVTMKIARRLFAATHNIVTKETNFYRNNMRKHSHNLCGQWSFVHIRFYWVLYQS